MTVEMSEYCEKLILEYDCPSTKSNNINELQKQVEKLTKEVKELHMKGKGGQVSNKSGKSKYSNMTDKPLNMNEKKSLGQNIRGLPPEYLRGV